MTDETKLTRDKYYTPEADQVYLSCSQYEDFMRCEAAALAKVQGRWTPPSSEAFLVGNFFHTAFEGPEAHAQFVEEHQAEILTKQGKLRAAFVKAQEMIDIALADPKIRQMVEAPGENEKIMTGKLFGRYPWKIRLDKYLAEPVRTILDWKTVANIWETKWIDEIGGRGSFVEAFRYLFRAAVYIEIEKQFTGSETDAAFWLVCISKQDPPDKEIVSLNHRQRLDLELEKLKDHLWRIQQIKDGYAVPKRCGRCAYCRSTKRLGLPIDYWQLEPESWPEREDEYDDVD